MTVSPYASQIAALQAQLSAVQAQINAQLYVSGAADANQNAQTVADQLRSEGYGVSITPATASGGAYHAYVNITSVPSPNSAGYLVGSRIGSTAPLQVPNPDPNTATLNELYAERTSIEDQLAVYSRETIAANTAATSPETTTAAPTNEEPITVEPTSTETTTTATPPFASRWFAAFVSFLSFGDTKL